MVAIGSAEDPYFITEIPGVQGNSNVSGRTPVDSRPVGSERILTFVVAGQSLAANSCTPSALYTPTHASKVQNLNFYDGAVYQMVDPALGPNGVAGTWFGRLGDKLIDASICDRVIFAPVAIGGTTIAQWTTGGVLNRHIPAAYRRLRSLGYEPSAVLWQLGETDGQIGTPQATFTAGLNALIGGVRGQGLNAPWLIAVSTYNLGVTNAAIQAALNAAPNGIDIFAGANTDTLTGSTYRETVFNTHLNATGADANATLWKTALDIVF